MENIMIDGDCSLSVMIDGSIDLSVTVDGEGGVFLPVNTDKYYQGTVDITPTDQAQVLQTKDLVMASDITIEPIPSNYGKIIYNGAYLRVE